MSVHAARERFTSMVTLDDEDIDLLTASLLIAQEEQPRFSLTNEIRRVDGLADRLRGHVRGTSDFFHGIYALNQVLFETMGFAGDTRSYDDPENSLMNRVLDRRRGIPITLSILYIEVGARLGLPLRGVGFPGHFLVRYDDAWGMTLVDPYHRGRIVLRPELRRRLGWFPGRRTPWRPELLQPASNRQILTRLLTNLKRSHLRHGNLERAALAAERLVILNPDLPRERRDRGLLYERIGHREAAIADLEDYLELVPDAADAGRIRHVLQRLRKRRVGEA